MFAALNPLMSQPVQPRLIDAALLARARAAQTDHEKLQIVFEKTRRELEAEAAPQVASRPKTRVSVRALFVVLPALVVAVAFIYLLWRAYPWAVFAWGDAEYKYNEIVERRKLVWAVVVVALVLGIVSNLFVASLPSFA
jgi:hypothetical protein